MTVLDSIMANERTLGGTGYTFIDADTIQDESGQNYRLEGFDSPEVEKWIGEYRRGDAGGQVATDTVVGLANDMGYTNIVPVLNPDGTPKVGKFGRPIVDLKDSSGRSFKSQLLESGVFDPSRYTSQQDVLTAELGQLERERNALRGTPTDTAWDQARITIEQGIKDENLYDGLFKKTALDESQLAAYRAAGFGNFVASDNVQVRDYGRTIGNDSLNPFSDSWEQGWIGVKESSFGVLNMLGETTGSEWLADIGEAGVERARTQIQDYGKTITDWKEIDDIGSAFDYLTNNMALSLPYMAISIGGAVASPFTGGLSLAAPASVYAGQTWNEMEGDKNAGIAIASGIAQAALDRLGLTGIVSAGGVGGTQLLKQATAALVQRGMTKEAAKRAVMAATRKEIAGFVGDAATIARQQILAKTVMKDFLKAGALGAGSEAVTEAMQEATGYTAAALGSDKAFDFEELFDRAMAGAIAGGALGGLFSVPSTAYNAGAWADVAVRQAPADAARLSQAAKHAEFEERTYGRVKSLPELLGETKAKMAGETHASTFQDKVASDKARKKDRTMSEVAFDTMAAAPSLWRGATRFIFQPRELDRSRSLRILADMYGGQLQRTFSGSSYENAKHHKVTVYKNMVSRPEEFYAQMNDGKVTNYKQRAELSDQIYAQLRAAIDPETKKIDKSKLDPQLAQLATELETLGDRLWQDQKAFNPELGYLDNYLMRYKAFDKTAIYNNKRGFVEALMEEFNMSEADAKDITDAITENENVNDFSDILEGHEAAGRPGSHKNRTLNLSEKERFKDFMNKDIFANVANAAKSAARYTAYQEYIGDNEGVVNQLLEDARKEGVSDETINRMANQLNNYFQAESGNYKRPETEFGKKLETIQRNLMVWMTVAGLPLATISSFVEAALTMRGLTMDQIMGSKHDGKGGLAALGTELGQTLWSGMGEISSVADRKQRAPAVTNGKKIIRDLGYYDWDVGTASISSTANKVGATEISVRKQKFLDSYFKATGLQGWTNYTRAVRAAIVGDYINDKLELISTAPEVTNEVQEAREQLRNLGINVNDAVAAYNSGGDINPDEMREAMFTFINDAVALPQSANRPLIYQDPRFALFTQFQGFIATFTANHIPKLWDEYVKRGTPAMKYNAFAVMATMIMLGFASQYLKDLIKHGEARPFGPDAHPWLDTSEYIQRGVRASGLLGTSERILDQFFPLYEKRSGSVGEWAWNAVSGESPALSFAGGMAKGAGDLLQGDVGGAAKSGVKATPLGPFNFIRDWAKEAGDNWNF